MSVRIVLGRRRPTVESQRRRAEELIADLARVLNWAMDQLGSAPTNGPLFMELMNLEYRTRCGIADLLGATSVRLGPDVLIQPPACATSRQLERTD